MVRSAAFGVFAGGLVIPNVLVIDNGSTQTVSSDSVVKDIFVGNAGGGTEGVVAHLAIPSLLR